MALDTLSINTLAYELNKLLYGGKINKINQPEKDEIILVIRNNSQNYKLIISASSSHPLIYINNNIEKNNPLIAPNFCMVLRKYLSSGIIKSIEQIDLDRIININISHRNEMGDIEEIKLIIEFMGKHSNIILVDKNSRILDSIKHIDASTSSVRQVFPGANYFRVNNDKQFNIDKLNNDQIIPLLDKNKSIYTNFMTIFKGLSPKLIFESSYLSGLDSNQLILDTDINELVNFINNIKLIMTEILEHKYNYILYYSNNIPYDFSVINYKMYNNLTTKSYNNIFDLIYDFYNTKLRISRNKEKTAYIKNIVVNNIKRINKKLNIWDKQLDEAKERNKYKLYGELLLANTYKDINDGYIECENYYDNYKKIKIKVDTRYSISKNSQLYYNKYNKLKRTENAIKKIYNSSIEELNYLHSIEESIFKVENTDDIDQIKQELICNNYISTIKNSKLKTIHKPNYLHYSDPYGYEYYVGKNNIQNEYVTFKIGENEDWWFHIKNLSGSHVIVKSNNNYELPDDVYIKAASLAAYYSQARNENKTEVDYIQRKFIKKPKNNHIGMVIYNTNYSIIVKPKIDDSLTLIAN